MTHATTDGRNGEADGVARLPGSNRRSSAGRTRTGAPGAEEVAWVARIRADLNRSGLLTDPDFRQVALDVTVRLAQRAVEAAPTSEAEELLTWA